jgi:hypothetical protein
VDEQPEEPPQVPELPNPIAYTFAAGPAPPGHRIFRRSYKLKAGPDALLRAFALHVDSAGNLCAVVEWSEEGRAEVPDAFRRLFE